MSTLATVFSPAINRSVSLATLASILMMYCRSTHTPAAVSFNTSLRSQSGKFRYAHFIMFDFANVMFLYSELVEIDLLLDHLVLLLATLCVVRPGSVDIH